MATDIREHILAGDGRGLVFLTVEQYHQMIEAGILGEGSQIELLDGLLVLKDRRDRSGLPGESPRHSLTVKRLLEAVQNVAETDQTHVRCQQPITLPPDNEPEPDLAVVIGKVDDYLNKNPGRNDVLAVMEVAGDSIRRDRLTKQRIYANARIKTYWIIDIFANQIEIYTQPQVGLGRYAQMQTVSHEDRVPLSLPDGSVVSSISVSDVLP